MDGTPPRLGDRRRNSSAASLHAEQLLRSESLPVRHSALQQQGPRTPQKSGDMPSVAPACGTPPRVLSSSQSRNPSHHGEWETHTHTHCRAASHYLRPTTLLLAACNSHCTRACVPRHMGGCVCLCVSACVQLSHPSYWSRPNGTSKQK